MPLIYLDYNASTPVDPEVADAMRPYLSDIFGNPSSIHSFGTRAKIAIENSRKEVARMINAHPDEIVFTSGGTESNNYAIKGIVLANQARGNHIITSSIEHPSVIEVCRYLETKGFFVTYLPVNREGVVDPGVLEDHITSSTILISIMHANNETGAIQPVEEIGRIAGKHGIPFHTDAAQSCGKIPVDVNVMQADLLTIAGHKCYAPKGVGALFIRRGIILEKLIHGADHEQNLRAGTENVASVAGLGTAAALSANFIRGMSGGDSNSGDPEKAQLMLFLRDQLFLKLKQEIPEIRLNGPVNQRLPNTVNVSFPGVEANLLLAKMDQVAASAGAACHAGSVSVSSVLAAMGIEPYYAMGTIRFSLGRMTTMEEIDLAVPMIIEAYRSLSGGTPPDLPVQAQEQIRLTHYTHGLGCACKIRPQVLESLLKGIPLTQDKNVLVGLGANDDAAVYRMDEETAIVQTVDIIPPVVDDPYSYGAIAAANSLSDVYAMGGEPLFALSFVGFPIHLLPIETLQQIMKGASDKAAEAGISIIGGHSIEDTEPKFGLVVTGRVHPDRILTNSNARPGDILILTKPIGSGILSTGIKRGVVSEQDKERLIFYMAQLNKTAAAIMCRYRTSSCTDITGFGLLGHLKEMVTGSATGAEIGVENVPYMNGVRDLAVANIIPGGSISNLEAVNEIALWDPGISETAKKILADAQTSGGLLIAVAAEDAKKMVADLHEAGISEAAMIGRITEGELKIRIRESLTF